LIAVFTDFMADEGTGSGATNGAHRAAKHGITSSAPDHGANAGADLGVGGVRCATTQGKGCSAGGRKKDVTDFHGKSPL